MANTYSNLSYGSSGDEVRKLQQSLINAGYDLGNTGADGKFGSKTQAAVKKYQADNGLTVDGIAGNHTLTALYGSLKDTSSTGSQTTQPEAGNETTATTPDYSKYAYDASSDAAYQQALAALQQASKETPTYAGTFDAHLNELYQQIINRDKFKYDLNSDMLYQQYKDQYTNLGKMAMKDTMGQAAALTGGYGSSYGQSVGQQQYDAYLQQLNDVVPELYGMAYDQYQQEGDDLYRQYAMAGDMANDEYGKYQDSLDQYWKNVAYLQEQADSAYNKGYTNWYNSYQMGTEAQNSAYTRLTELMTLSGYKPTDGELAEAGMTRQQADDFLNGWKAANPDLAYRTGAITGEEYYALTGAYPPGYTPASAGGGGGNATNWEYQAAGQFGLKMDGTPVGEGKNGSYSFGELMDAAAGGMGYTAIASELEARGVDTSSPAVQADIRAAIRK